MSARFRLVFLHYGTHQYYDLSRGELGLEVTAKSQEAAEYFGRRLANAMNVPDKDIEFHYAEALPTPEEKPDGENVV